MGKQYKIENLLNSLLEVSNTNSNKSLFQQRFNKELSSPAIQHHINALINELLTLDKSSVNSLSVTRIGNGEMYKKSNKSNVNKGLPILNLQARIQNIKVGAEFSEIVQFDKSVEGDMTFIKTKSVDEFAGIDFDSQTMTLSGKADFAGDYEFVLYGILNLTNGDRQPLTAKIQVTFVPDPKSLWKNIPSDKTKRFHKPDIFSSYCENELMLLVGSSVRGRSHAHKGIHRDDDFKLFCDESSEWVVSCVADGAGSCKYSRHGAFVAAAHSTRSLKESLKGHYGVELEKAFNNFCEDKTEENQRALYEIYQHTIVKAVYAAMKAIHDSVDEGEGDSVKDFSTTLILAAHKKTPKGHLVVSFWIGDGGVVIYDKNNAVTLMGEADSGEYAGQTRFLDNKIFEDRSVYSRIRIELVDSMTSLILATDGITDAWFETEKQLESLIHWDKLWSELEPHLLNMNRDEGLEGLTKWMDFWSKGNHDDRTISICLVKE